MTRSSSQGFRAKTRAKTAFSSRPSRKTPTNAAMGYVSHQDFLQGLGRASQRQSMSNLRLRANANQLSQGSPSSQRRMYQSQGNLAGGLRKLNNQGQALINQAQFFS